MRRQVGLAFLQQAGKRRAARQLARLRAFKPEPRALLPAALGGSGPSSSAPFAHSTAGVALGCEKAPAICGFAAGATCAAWRKRAMAGG